MPERARRANGASLSVRARIVGVILALAIIAFSVAGLTMYLLLRAHILEGVDERLDGVVAAAEFAVNGEATATGGGLTSVAPDRAYATTADLLTFVFGALVQGANESSVGLLDGVPAVRPASVRPFAPEDDPAFIARVVDETAAGVIVRGTAITDVGALRYVAVPMRVRGDPVQAVYISAVDLDAELDPLDAFGTYMLIAFGAVVVIGVVGWLVAGRLLAPIRRLRETATRISITDLSERIPVRGADDVSALTGTINDMLDRLERSVDAQQHLLDDVRHELGTPITIMRGHLELMDANAPDEVVATRDLALDEIDRMHRLLDDIQVLAGSRRALVAPEHVDVGALTRQVYEKASALPGHPFELGEVAERSAWLDPQRITQAWLQLADNAAKYAPEGTPIEIGSRVLPDARIELWVRDHGPGIAPEAQARVFERFGRVEPGRGVRGSGLGLAIVSAIAAAHGGEVQLASAVGVGSRFAIVLPVGEPDGAAA